MKKSLLAGFAFAALAVPAVAADMPVKARPPVAIDIWTGGYVGANVGYGWGRDTINPSVSGQCRPRRRPVAAGSGLCNTKLRLGPSGDFQLRVSPQWLHLRGSGGPQLARSQHVLDLGRRTGCGSRLPGHVRLPQHHVYECYPARRFLPSRSLRPRRSRRRLYARHPSWPRRPSVGTEYPLLSTGGLAFANALQMHFRSELTSPGLGPYNSFWPGQSGAFRPDRGRWRRVEVDRQLECQGRVPLCRPGQPGVQHERAHHGLRGPAAVLSA